MYIKKVCYIFAPRKVSKVMETNQKSLLDTYLKYHGWVLNPKNSKRDAMPFVPMFLVDAMNLIYKQYIKPLPLRHRAKQMSNRWHEAYMHFIKEFFRPFDIDQQCELCDMVDEFNDYIHNEIELFRVEVMQRFMKYDADVRLTLSAILACNVLAQSAQIVHKGLTHKDNMYIASMESWSYKLLNEYADPRIDRTGKNINLNEYESLRNSVNNISKKVMEFAKKLEL